MNCITQQKNYKYNQKSSITFFVTTNELIPEDSLQKFCLCIEAENNQNMDLRNKEIKKNLSQDDDSY